MYEDLEVRVAEPTAFLEAAKAELRRVINTDELTGLASRSLLQEKVAEAVAAAGARHQPALILLDLDSFRLIDDSLGHAAGGCRPAGGGPAAGRGGRGRPPDRPPQRR